MNRGVRCRSGGRPIPGKDSSMDTVISKDGSVIAFERTGSGPPLVLVDGALCSRDFGPMPALAKRLANDFTVYCYDRRGRGGSTDAQPYAAVHEIEDIAALIEHAGGEAFLYGVSSGAALALRAAAVELPIRKVAVFEPPWEIDRLPAIPMDVHRARLNALLDAGRRGDAVKYFMRDMVGLRGFTATVMLAAMRLSPVWRKLEAVAHTLPYETGILGDGILPREMLASIGIPVLAMAGGKSPEALQEPARVIAESCRTAQARTLPGQTHNASADAIAPELIAFFRA